jgi:adenine-specific DNA-methyltransferase
MASPKKPAKSRKRPIERYEHTDKKRANNPPVGLVTPETDPVTPTHKVYDYVQPVPTVRPGKELEYDPHLDPQLVWAGKKEHTSFEVPTVSLHVHETIDPRTIIEAVRKRNGNGLPVQPSLFERPEEKLPLRDAIDFYKHAHGWSNRLIAGDSLLVMNSLLEKEGMSGQVQTAYIDPPYGIRYRSNFQAFVNRSDVPQSDRDEDLTQEPEMVQAFRDAWELEVHSYLTYLRDRLLLAKELLHDDGSCFVQISDKNLHLVRNIMDEVFGPQNFVALIPFRKKTMPLGTVLLEQMSDFLLWYAKEKFDANGKRRVKYRRLYLSRSVEGEFHHCWYELPDETRHRMSKYQLYDHSLLPPGARVYRLKSLEPSGPMESGMYDYEFDGVVYKHPANGYGTSTAGMDRLVKARRIQAEGNRLTFVLYADESEATQMTAPWTDTVGADGKVFVVQTNTEVIKRCLLMTTDPGDLVLDPTCGSGTTAYVAERWGRRWITCDTSRVAITLAKQRLMTAEFDYYELAHSEEGIGSGFRYETVPHITLKSIANNPDISDGMTRDQIEAATARYAEEHRTLYDKPDIDKSRVRVTGPFTVEAVPAPTVRSLDEIEEGTVIIGAAPAQESLADFRHAATPLLDASVARKGATLRQSEWRDELLKTGLRGKGGHHIDFARVEPLAGTRWLHADAETKGAKPQRVVFSFGPEYSLLEQRQVELAWEEARTLSPKPDILVFAAFEFDPEAAKDIDAMTKEKTGMTFLTAQMNADLLTGDLKRKRASNQGFWLVGRPDVELRHVKTGEYKGQYEVEVRGFDYYNTRTGTIESGDTSKIAMWLLDTDYDGRSLYPRQVFFPIAGENEGWASLARNLKAEIDRELIEAYRGTVSLPFEPGPHKRIAIKVVDDRGIESLKVVEAK